MTPIYHIALCDDDSLFLSSFIPKLTDVLERKSVEHTLTCFEDTNSLLQAIEHGSSFDLIFLDILILDENGMELARELRRKGLLTDIIFVTSSAGYAVDGYDVRPLHYLLKPVQEEKLEIAVSRFLEKHTSDRLLIQTGRNTLSLNVSDILYLEIFGHDIAIHTLDGSIIPYIGTLKDMETLLSPYSFCRSHKSYLINLAHVTGVSRMQVRLVSGDVFPIGKSRYREFQSSFIEYANKRHSY